MVDTERVNLLLEQMKENITIATACIDSLRYARVIRQMEWIAIWAETIIVEINDGLTE